MALSTLVLSGVLLAPSIPGHTSTQTPADDQSLSVVSRQVASSSGFQTTALEQSVFEQINRYRMARRLPRLTLNAKITRQARIHSRNMARGKAQFSHDGFEQRVYALPLRYRSAAENLAFNRGYSDPANQAVVGWLESPGHLKNIQGNYNLTGIGVATNQRGEVYLTQIFLRTP
jgi:uncharacterized protein YkwD